MGLESWVLTLSKFKETSLEAIDLLLRRVSIEEVEQSDGTVVAKAVWFGERGNGKKSSVEAEVRRDFEPRLEYWEMNDRRKVSLRSSKDFSVEFDEETLDRLAEPKMAGVAMATGAVLGLTGWAVIRILSRISLVKAEPELIASERDETAIETSENRSRD